MHISSSQLGGQFSLLDLCLLPQIKVTATSPVSGLFICLFICQEQKSTHTITLEIRALCHGHGRNSMDAGLPYSQLQGGVAQISCCTPDFVIDAHSMDSTRAQRQTRECSRIKGWAIRPTWWSLHGRWGCHGNQKATESGKLLIPSPSGSSLHIGFCSRLFLSPL